MIKALRWQRPGQSLGSVTNLENTMPENTTTVAAEAIATADAHLNNAVLPTYSELLAALRTVKATAAPFRSIEDGGLGLPYTTDNLTPESWKARTDLANNAIEALLTRHDRTMAGDFGG